MRYKVRFSTLLGKPPLQPQCPWNWIAKMSFHSLFLSLAVFPSQPERCQPERLSLDTIRAGAWFPLLHGEVSFVQAGLAAKRRRAVEFKLVSRAGEERAGLDNKGGFCLSSG